MCASAIYWAEVGRVVFGLSEERLRLLRNVNTSTAALIIGCRDVLSSGGHVIEVLGPMLEDDAAVQHRLFWPQYRT